MNPIDSNSAVTRRVVGTIGANATILNVGLLVLCGWYVATGEPIPDILLGAVIGLAGNGLGGLLSVLNSTGRTPPPSGVQDVQVVNAGPAEAVPVVADPAD